MPDGSTVLVQGVTLSDQAFTDGGGFIDDGTGGIAVLLTDGSFPRGVELRVSGTVDDRYSQRTIRSDSAGIVIVGSATEPAAASSATGLVGEALEGRLVRLSGEVTSSLDTLTTAIALDLDDGSGPARIVVGTTTGIDTSLWARGVRLTLIGIVGQRDSSGSGTAGYRVQPRDAADILVVEPPATPSPTTSPEPTVTSTPSPSGTPNASPSPSPSAGSGVVPISTARAAATGTHLRIRGVVTAPSGLIDPASAVVQDLTGAILIRLGTDVGTLARGQLVELDGVRSTMSGMLSLRVSVAPVVLGTQSEPPAFHGGTGILGESQEAWLVDVHGAVVTPILRSTSGTVSFSVDDGSGPLRVSISSRSGIVTTAITRGAWFELRGVLAQETTGREPDRGYRLWPRVQADIVAVSGPAGSSASPGPSASPPAGPAPILTWPRSSASPGPSGHPAGQDGTGDIPQLSVSLPTASPSGSATATADTQQPATGDLTRAGALLGGAFGMAIIAGYLAWRGRRMRPDPDPPPEEATADELVPRLAVVPLNTVDTHEEQRILPPI